jgi:hypothetical protein
MPLAMHAPAFENLPAVALLVQEVLARRRLEQIANAFGTVNHNTCVIAGWGRSYRSMSP